MKRLTIGMRAKFVPATDGNTSWSEYNGQECLLKERSSGGNFAVMILGQPELKRKDPETVVNQVAWVDESELESVDADFDNNLEFMDWYQEHEDDFCPDCGDWFPNNGKINPDSDEDYICPNEGCPGRLHN